MDWAFRVETGMDRRSRKFAPARRALGLALIAFAMFAGLPGAAAADWRADIKVFRIGLLGGANPAYRLRQVEPFRKYMELKLGLPVELVAMPSYGALIEAEAGGRLSYAILSASAYATAAASCQCVEPLALPRGSTGAMGFFSVLIVKASSPINTLADTKGTRLAYARGASVAGHLVPFAALAAAGIDPQAHFGSLVPVSDVEAAASQLLRGGADVAIAWASLSGSASQGYDRSSLKRLVSSGALTMGDIRIVWTSPLIPFGPHAARSDLPVELKDLLRDALISMAEKDPLALEAVDREGGLGFALVDPAQYEILRRVVLGSAVSD